MKIGAMIESFRLDFPEAARAAREAGADGVQIYANGVVHADMTAAEKREVRRILEGEGLVLSAVCGDFGCEMFYRPESCRALIDREKLVMETALDLGTPIVTTHIGAVSEDETCPQYRTMQSVCKELADFADSVGGRFAVETGPEPAALLKRFLDGLSSRGVSVNLDPANLVMCSGDDPAAAVYLLRDYIVHTHAKDGIRKIAVDPRRIYAANFYGIPPAPAGAFEEVPLGEGGVDWNAYLAALRDIGYDGFLTVERECGEKPAEDIGRAVRFLKERI